MDLNDEAVHIAGSACGSRRPSGEGADQPRPQHPRRQQRRADPAVHPRAFDWTDRVPRSLRADGGGFDVVIGNPPYIRQEWLSPYQAVFAIAYAAYDGMADLYVYFYELGLSLLKPGGRLSFVVTNKWMKAGYGEPLRRSSRERGLGRIGVDFGHAKQIFQDADVFPSIIVVRRPTAELPPATTRVCAIPREQLRIDDLSVQIAKEGHPIERDRLGSEPWIIEPPDVMAVLNRIGEHGIPLRQFAGSRMYTGIKTGCNEAFLIKTTAERDAIVAGDSACTDIIRPYLAGENMDRWAADWDGTWMIALK